jgi:hypothetical protein
MTIAPNGKSLHISTSIDLSREIYAESRDYELACCSVSPDPLVSAAEFIYDITKNPGNVVKNAITFKVSDDELIKVNLLNGVFSIERKNQPIRTGRKVIELIILWQNISFEKAVQLIAEMYSVEQAEIAANDYVKIRISALRKQ